MSDHLTIYISNKLAIYFISFLEQFRSQARQSERASNSMASNIEKLGLFDSDRFGHFWHRRSDHRSVSERPIWAWIYVLKCKVSDKQV